MALRILNPGLMTTIQDLGRYGYAHLGVTPAGAADALALRVANRLLGNEENTAALEMTLLGATVEFQRAAIVVLTGAQVDCRMGTAKAPMWRAFPVLPGAVLKCGAITGGARAYLAVQGGFELKPVMGSVATLRSAHLGGLEGRALKAGDQLEVNHVASSGVRGISRQALAYLEPRHELRVTPGPQASWIGAEGMQMLQRGAYVVSGDSDRRGIRFQGEALTLPPKSQLITEGISLGAMQVPPDGQPIILFVDQQTTGGYPKVANVIAADLRHVAQLRPRDEVHFRVVTVEEALGLLREQEEWLRKAFQIV
jgi:antagonist of KipI